jgi:hypothetical protein
MSDPEHTTSSPMRFKTGEEARKDLSIGCKQLRKPPPVKQKNKPFIWFIEGNDQIEGSVHTR